MKRNILFSILATVAMLSLGYGLNADANMNSERPQNLPNLGPTSGDDQRMYNDGAPAAGGAYSCGTQFGAPGFCYNKSSECAKNCSKSCVKRAKHWQCPI